MGISVVEVVTAGPKGKDGSGIGIPADGVLGEVLMKTSNTSYEVEWRTPGERAVPPTMIGPTLPVSSDQVITLTITNFSTDTLYHASVAHGTVTIDKEVVTWVPGFVPASATYTCDVFAIKASQMPSAATKHPVQLLKA